jgi:hypothetical protein
MYCLHIRLDIGRINKLAARLPAVPLHYQSVDRFQAAMVHNELHPPHTCGHVLDFPSQLGLDLGEDEGVIEGTPPTTLHEEADTAYHSWARQKDPGEIAAITTDMSQHYACDWYHGFFCVQNL